MSEQMQAQTHAEWQAEVNRRLDAAESQLAEHGRVIAALVENQRATSGSLNVDGTTPRVRDLAKANLARLTAATSPSPAETANHPVTPESSASPQKVGERWGLWTTSHNDPRWWKNADMAGLPPREFTSREDAKHYRDEQSSCPDIWEPRLLRTPPPPPATQGQTTEPEIEVVECPAAMGYRIERGEMAYSASNGWIRYGWTSFIDRAVAEAVADYLRVAGGGKGP